MYVRDRQRNNSDIAAATVGVVDLWVIMTMMILIINCRDGDGRGRYGSGDDDSIGDDHNDDDDDCIDDNDDGNDDCEENSVDVVKVGGDNNNCSNGDNGKPDDNSNIPMLLLSS